MVLSGVMRKVSPVRVSAISCWVLPSCALIRRRVVFRGMCSSAIASECAAPQNLSASHVKPYDEVPGPRPIPILGNTWRMLPVVGQYRISDVGKISQMFYDEYGKIVRFGGLMGRPDLLFVYDADEIEKVYRQEGSTPFRPSMPCLVYYKSIVRKDFFGDLPGVVGVHGEQWKEFRTRVQKPVLQPQTIRKYITPIEIVTKDFIKRIEEIKDHDDELPGDFDNEIHKWALEC